MDFPVESFLGGLFAQSMLGVWSSESEVLTKIPIISAISIRFDPDINLLKETIKENFLKEPSDFVLSYNTKDFDIKVKGESFFELFENCSYDEYKNDAFLTIAISDSKGIPITKNITLLRQFIAKLKSNQVKFEIW